MTDDDLRAIIAAYDQATQGLQRTHENLQAEVARLSGELAGKNRELTASLAQVSALKNYLANLIESIDGVIAIDRERRVTIFNQAVVQVVAATNGEWQGRELDEVLPPTARELGALLTRALSEARPLTNIEIVLHESPAAARVLSVSANPLRDEKGEILGAVQTFRDLTEIKRLEMKAARQERLAELGEMAAGVAHEIRNPLGGIELYASNLQRRLPAESKEAEIAGKIGKAAQALNRIVTDMLTFTRQREPALQPCDPARPARAAWEMAAGEADKKAATVEWQITTAGRKVKLDGDQIAQAALNVILNAIQFMPRGGGLTIGVRFAAADDGEHLIYEFTDDGPGVLAENHGKLFNPFFTTRQEGTGLGLAIVHKIILDHGGTIAVENRPPRGACFIFTLPLWRAD
ncbi:hypothetical protein FACS1894139_01570 [Planctomycetales bacterium]|nr:hypothetical protein FACS1894139_01570 [Planctomycetales bacterium]GHV21522.1 hypothetical protein AGMMS49959_10790 [Planctomycetales bacterium]